MRSHNALEQALARLQSAAPEQYRQLGEAFSAYATEIAVGLTEAPPDKIMNVQGRAQEARSLLRLIAEAPSRNRRN